MSKSKNAVAAQPKKPTNKKPAVDAVGGKPLINRVPCEFGTVSLQATTTTIRVSVKNGAMSRKQLFELANTQLTARLELDPNAADDAAGQNTFSRPDKELTAIADCPSISDNGKKRTFSLVFHHSGVDWTELGAMAHSAGYLTIDNAEERKKPDRTKAKAKDKDNGNDVRGQHVLQIKDDEGDDGEE